MSHMIPHFHNLRITLTQMWYPPTKGTKLASSRSESERIILRAYHVLWHGMRYFKKYWNRNIKETWPMNKMMVRIYLVSHFPTFAFVYPDSRYKISIEPHRDRAGWRHMGLLPHAQNCGLRMRRECRERSHRHRRLAIPTCITARASRTCRDACRDR